MQASPWRVIRHEAANGAWNMAVDEAIAQMVGHGQAPPTLRFYTWNPYAVSLGYLQSAPGGADLEACRRHGIELVRRITGGRAVLHAHELTYSVAIPSWHSWGSLSVVELFSRISAGLIVGLERLGVAASLGESRTTGESESEAGACFLQRERPAILVRGRKLIGSAQRRWRRSLLQHGSILLDFDSHLHQAVFPAWPRSDPARGVTWLRALAGKVVCTDELTAILGSAWCQALRLSGVPGDLTPGERSMAQELAGRKYGSLAWTYLR
jgi:lipoate-protein ligase A